MFTVRDLPPAEVSARAALIADAVDRLERMTSETLDFARGAERLVRRPVPLGLLLADLVAWIEEELPGLVVQRDFDVPAGRRGVLDVDKLRRAVSNVAANARDAMGGRGRLTLAARVEALPGPDGAREHLVLVLGDEGPGVAAGIRERVFEPFVTLGKRRGTGLGLAVARRFVEDHGGRLELLPGPEPPARGARFRIALPLVPAEGASPGGAVPLTLHDGSAAGRRVPAARRRTAGARALHGKRLRRRLVAGHGAARRDAPGGSEVDRVESPRLPGGAGTVRDQAWFAG